MHLRAQHHLTLTGAQAALEAALAFAHEAKVPVNIAVTDGSGVLLAFARMDGAFTHSGAIAVDKARTVCGFGGLATDDLYAAVEAEPSVRDGIAGRAGVALFGGGVPVMARGQLAGAVGVSGGSAAQDKQIALAGAQAISDDEGMPQ